MPIITLQQGEPIPLMVNNIFKEFTNLKVKDKKILVKPNLCNYCGPETGTTTDVSLVKAILQYLLSQGGRPEIIESDGSNINMAIASKLLGYVQIADELGIPIHNLAREPTIVRSYPNNHILKRIQYPEVFVDADLLISVPKLKTMTKYGLTCALKNQFGCLPTTKKARLHPWLEEVIVDVNRIFPPDLVIVDGLVAMEGRGPAGGVPRRLNLLLAGDNPLVVDIVAAKIMGLKPMDVGQIKEAMKSDLANFDEITFKGVSPETIKTKFNNPISPIQRILDFAVDIAKQVGAVNVL